MQERFNVLGIDESEDYSKGVEKLVMQELRFRII
jgi:hypothetical protein